MSSFPPPLPLPPTPPLPHPLRFNYSSNTDDVKVCCAGHLHIAAKEGLCWCINKCKVITNKEDRGLSHRFFVALAMAAAGFATIGLAPNLLPRSKALIVNFWGFAGPALVTIAKMDTTENHNTKQSPISSGYWVLFGLSCILDDILPAVTPFYFFTKACILAWGGSSARPYGGRQVIDRTFEIINASESRARLSAPMEKLASKVGIPLKKFRSTIAAAVFATGTVVFGVFIWIVLAVEAFFSSRPLWAQAKICVVVGVCWPLYATVVAQARAGTAGTRGNGEGPQDKRRQGPAAVQWLSYWPIFAFFSVVFDPIIGWAPHYYSVKLAILVFLALPQTRGAYLITSLILNWNQSTRFAPGSDIISLAVGRQGVTVINAVPPD